MNSIQLIFVVFAIAFVSAQNIITIDNFSEGDSAVFALLTNGATFPIIKSDTASGSTSNVIGGHRTIILQIDGGNTAAITSIKVDNDNENLSITSESSANGVATIHWDGNQFSTLNPLGLENIDLTTSGVDAFRILLESDITSSITLNVYSGSISNVCSRTFTSQSNIDEFVLPYSSFTQGCSFDDVGAIEMLVNFSPSSDFLISSITLVTSNIVVDDDDYSTIDDDYSTIDDDYYSTVDYSTIDDDYSTVDYSTIDDDFSTIDYSTVDYSTLDDDYSTVDYSTIDDDDSNNDDNNNNDDDDLLFSSAWIVFPSFLLSVVCLLF